MNRWTYADKKREEIPMGNLYKELRKYDTYSFNVKERNNISSGFQYSMHSLFNGFWVDKHKTYDVMIFDAPYGRHGESRADLKIDVREIAKVEKVVNGQHKYDMNFIIFTFKDNTELAIFCHKMGKSEKGRTDDAALILDFLTDKC